MKTIGERIRQEREAQGLTIRELAADAGLAKGTLGDLEKGESKSTTKLHRIASRLGVRTEWLETGRGPRALDVTSNEESQDGTVRLPTDLPTAASQPVRPDFTKIASASFLLREYLAIVRDDPELLFDARMLELAYEAVELRESSPENSNVVDLMKFMSRRAQETGITNGNRSGGAEEARAGTR